MRLTAQGNARGDDDDCKYGHLANAVQGYKLVYLQKLNNRSIYWGASADTDNQLTTNLLEVVMQVLMTNSSVRQANGAVSLPLAIRRRSSHGKLHKKHSSDWVLTRKIWSAAIV